MSTKVKLFQILPETFFQIKVLVSHAVRKIVLTFPTGLSSNHDQLYYSINEYRVITEYNKITPFHI